LAQEDSLLALLQQGIPFCKRPFEALADEIGCDEADVLAFLDGCREQELVRRFGAVFDTRRLGYRSALCAAVVPPSELDAVAARLTPLSGVTHCYERKSVTLHPSPFAFPNLWFTLSYPSDIFAAMADEVAARLKPLAVHVLPATRRYKVDVVFGAATRARDESVEDDMPVTARDRAIIRALQGDTATRPDYFAALAETLGMKEWDLLATLELWRRRGRLKRIGLLLAHRNAGWTANGMCCWRIEGDTTEAGRALATCDEVTHCYERPEAPGFPFNLFAMIHARSPEEASATFARLEEACQLSAGTMLISTREYKKTSMTFFVG
jgi:DNA-binding Lrp family transcriptional regulator